MAARYTLYWNGKDLPDELRAMPPGTYVIESVDALDDEEKAELQREIEASFDEEAAGRLIDIAEATSDLRAIR